MKNVYSNIVNNVNETTHKNHNELIKNTNQIYVHNHSTFTNNKNTNTNTTINKDIIIHNNKDKNVKSSSIETYEKQYNINIHKNCNNTIDKTYNLYI